LDTPLYTRYVAYILCHI